MTPSRRTPATITYPAELPIAQRRDELLTAIGDNQVVVVAGETGSGKSTQLPKLCLELGRGTDGWIGHTQPRRIAARAVAERVSEELGDALGSTVGYAVRFTDRVSDRTMVKVMTDGILLAEIQRDQRLSRYDTVIIDEAHERSLNIDFLLGYLAQLLPRRPDLKVIITSATIDTERFSRHFDDAPIIEVSGRTHPVEIRYRPLDADPPIDQTQGICDAVEELFTEQDGDVLVFCSGEREIRDAVEALGELALPDTEILPLFARLSAADQHRVFAQHRNRRIVVATNVAETSLTVPGIKAVVDSGTARISRYNRRTKVQRLPIEPISQASANQRSGRCGRIAPGIAIRLYDEDDYEARPEFTDPEIQRTNLASVILQMTALGLGDVERFPFVDAPDTRSIRDGIALLEELDAVRWRTPRRRRRRGRSSDADEGRRRKELVLTPVGRKLARIPIDPRLGRMLLAADDHGCLEEVTVLAAALSIQDPRERPRDDPDAAVASHRRFADEHSDFVSLLNLWTYLREQRNAMSSSAFRRLCRREYLHYLRIREWQDLHSQLRRVGKEIGLRRNHSPAEPDVVHLALLAGLLSQVGMRDDRRDRRDETRGGRRPGPVEYLGARGGRFAVAPGSALSRRGASWIMAAELVETNRMWARTVARTRPEDIEAAADHLVKRSYTDPHWDRERGSAIAGETVTLYGLPLVTGRTVQWGRIDPDDARELFIRHALVGDEWDRRHAFIAHNAERIDEVRRLEARERRSDMLIGTDELVDWYAARLPDHVTTARHFDRWWKRAQRETPELLHLRVEDLIAPDATPLDALAFPDRWSHGDLELALHYEFDPSSPDDGMTVEIPAGALGRIEDGTFDWLVPGLRTELATAVARSLPKRYRKALMPIPETIDQVVPRLDPQRGSLVDVMREELGRAGSVDIPADAVDLATLPLHLRPNFRVVDEAGTILATGGDLRALKNLLDARVRASLDASAHDLEQVGLTTWSVGEIPARVDIEGAGHTVAAYPALVDEGDSVALRLLPSRAEQAAAMWAGTRRLLMLNRPSVSKSLRDLLTDDVKLALVRSPYPAPSDWFEDLVGCAVEEIMLERDAPAWTATEWDRLLHHVRDGLPVRVGRIGRASAGILTRLHEAESLLARRNAPKFAAAAADVRAQLDGLVYPGFLTAVGSRNLPRIARYLEAVAHRLERLPEHPDRDRDAMARVQLLDREHDRLVDQFGWSPGLEDVLWQLQELRVSLFAQHLGTDGPVSEKRIRTTLDTITSP